MWIFTTRGYVSLVVDKRDKNKINVRARVADDITRNFPGAKVYITNGGDYRYRASIKRAEVAIVLAEQIMDMDYTSHFKDVALRESGGPAGRHEAYYAVWGAMGRLQDYAPYSKTSRADMAKFPASKSWTPGSYAGGLYDGDYAYGTGNHYYDDRLPKNWKSKSDLDIDTPDVDADDPFETDDEIDEAIDEATRRFGLGVVDNLSEEEWEETLTAIVKENREKEAEKAKFFRQPMEFTPRRKTPAKRRRDRRRNR